MAYIDEGEGAPIVFAHGNPTFSTVFEFDHLAITAGESLDLSEFAAVYGTPSQELKDAIAGLNPVYMAPLGGFRR